MKNYLVAIVCIFLAYVPFSNASYRSTVNPNFDYVNTTPTVITTYSYPDLPTYYVTPTYISCTDTYGIHAKDNFNGTCSCWDGYSFQKDNYGNTTCKQKAYSTYALVEEQKNNDLLIVFKNYSGFITVSKITSYDCPGAYYYLGKMSVLNMLYDNVLNVGDFLILPDKQVCSISSVENNLPEDTTLKTCSEAYGENSIDNGGGQCSCKKGYKWAKDKKSCIKNLSCKKGQLIRNGMCIDISSFK